MSISTNKFTDITAREPAWARYSFAVTTCAMAMLLQVFLNGLTTDRLYPFLPAVAAIIASAAWAGTGPGLLATGLMVCWSGFDLSWHGLTAPNILLRCAMLLVEGVLLGYGSARMWRSKREAAMSESWHRQLVETAAEGIWVHDEAGVITYANARMAEILGVTGDNLIGRNVDEFFLPADRSVERIRAANLHIGHKEQFDRRLRRPDGVEIWVLTCSNLIVDGENPGTLAMMTDITQRKRAEHALRRSEERFRNLFEAVLEGVYQSTPDGRITAANPMFLQILGLANEMELNSLDIARDLYVDRHMRERLLAQLERDGGFQNVEYDLRRRDGQVITVLENAHVVRDEQGTILYYEGTLTDITPRRRIEERLRQAQKVEALGRLAGSVAQDFNNILTIVTGFTQLALSELPPVHPARSSMEQAIEASGTAMAITRQLLSFSRRQSPTEGIVDLNQAVDRSETVRQPDVVISRSRERVPVYAGHKQFEPVIWDLCDKIRSSFPGSGLAVKTALVTLGEEHCQSSVFVQPGLYGVLSVGTGSGAPEQSPLFEAGSPPPGAAFSPMHAGESASMGLSATYAAVAQCGGFIVADARHESGKFLCFHVFLPCAVTGEEDGIDIGPLGAAGETILLVEDEPLIRELSRDMLERQGYRVILAADAKEAEQLGGTSGRFDLLITDAVMPAMSGAELARRLRASHPELKVLFISGYADDPPERGSPAAEGAVFLQKPFSADSLGRKIRQMLGSAE